MNALRGGFWLRLMSPVVCAALLIGCATEKVDWAPRVGHYTYDQAVLEFGPPDKYARLTDGTIVAEWLTVRGAAYSQATTLGSGGGYPYWYGPPGPTFIDTYQSPNRYIRLTFGPDGLLQAWKTVYH